MTLPRWKPTKAERDAFVNFVISELDAADHERLIQGLSRIADSNAASTSPESRVAFIRAVANSGASPAILERVSFLAGIDVAEIAYQLERLESIGFEIKRQRKKVGAKGKQRSDAYRNAVEDVPRIRALFVKHWGQRNRLDPPMAEEIAAVRWNLSPDEATALIVRFQKKPGLSDK